MGISFSETTERAKVTFEDIAEEEANFAKKVFNHNPTPSDDSIRFVQSRENQSGTLRLVNLSREKTAKKAGVLFPREA